ncbi:MAG TPA: hypothetical protein VGZ29_11450 [Terriglobia bacterium]|nr:hypothetical protein [Terriglobia bacterium]
MFKDRKGQQQTLSIRVSEGVREFLDRARKQFSDTQGEALSISDVAKLLLESAIENRLDDRLETTELLARPTEALLGIRQKWANNLELARAEWIVLAQYAQAGCEDMTSDPALPSRQSFANILEAFLAVRALRVHAAPDKDAYYLGNLSGWIDRGDGTRRIAGERNPEIVPAVVGRLVEQLRESSTVERPSFAGRNLYVVLRDEHLQGADALNRALTPYLPGLYRLAARGHWLLERRPIRKERRPWDTLESSPQGVPNVEVGDLMLTTLVSQEGELHMLLNLRSHRVAYALGPYPHIREFQAMLGEVAPGKIWNGRYFFAHTDHLSRVHRQEGTEATKFYFREHTKGVLVEMTSAEWEQLKTLFAQLMELAELRLTLAELALQYGEV